MTDGLRGMLPAVLSETGIDKESSLNAIIGGKSAHFIDLHHEVILSPDQYATLYMRGLPQLSEDRSLARIAGGWTNASVSSRMLFMRLTRGLLGNERPACPPARWAAMSARFFDRVR